MNVTGSSHTCYTNTSSLSRRKDQSDLSVVPDVGTVVADAVRVPPLCVLFSKRTECELSHRMLRTWSVSREACNSFAAVPPSGQTE